MRLDRFCAAYFSGFSDLWNHRVHTRGEKSLAVGKIFLNIIVFPVSLLVGAVYGACKLKERCSRSVPNPSTARRTESAASQAAFSQEGREGETPEPGAPTSEAVPLLRKRATDRASLGSSSSSSSVLTAPGTASGIPPSSGKPPFVFHMDDADEKHRRELEQAKAEGREIILTNAPAPERAQGIREELGEIQRTRAIRVRTKGVTLLTDASEEALRIGAQRKSERQALSVDAALKSLESEGIDLTKRTYLFGSLWEDLTEDVSAKGKQVKTYREIAAEIIQMINMVIINAADPAFFQSDTNAVIFLPKELNPYSVLDPQHQAINIRQYEEIGVPAGPAPARFSEFSEVRNRGLINQIFAALKNQGIIQGYEMSPRGIEILL